MQNEQLQDELKTQPTHPNAPQQTTESEIAKLSAKEQKKLAELKLEAITHRERGKFDLYEKKLIEALAIDPENIELLKLL